MSLVHNERTKLLAAALDRVSTACVTIGVLGPLAAYLYGVGSVIASGVLLFSTFAWIAAAIGLHIFARRILGDLL
jgi:hypothetical protein